MSALQSAAATLAPRNTDDLRPSRCSTCQLHFLCLPRAVCVSRRWFMAARRAEGLPADRSTCMASMSPSSSRPAKPLSKGTASLSDFPRRWRFRGRKTPPRHAEGLTWKSVVCLSGSAGTMCPCQTVNPTVAKLQRSSTSRTPTAWRRGVLPDLPVERSRDDKEGPANVHVRGAHRVVVTGEARRSVAHNEQVE